MKQKTKKMNCITSTNTYKKTLIIFDFDYFYLVIIIRGVLGFWGKKENT